MSDESIDHGAAATAEPTVAPNAPDSALPPQPVKRKRGRPPKAATAAVDGATASVSPEGAKRRGRPPKHRVYDDGARATLARQIVGLHLVAAQATGIAELQISEAEGIALSEALATLAQEYDLALSGKTGALIQLAATAAMIYAPRLIALKKRSQKPHIVKTISEKDTHSDGAAVAAH